MNAELQRTQRRIEKITQRLEYQLGIDGWLEVRHHFVEGFDGDTTLGEDGPQINSSLACTTALWEYRTMKISWFLAVCASQSDERLEQTAIHEYVHGLIAPVTSLIKTVPPVNCKLEELATESVARVITHALAQ